MGNPSDTIRWWKVRRIIGKRNDSVTLEDGVTFRSPCLKDAEPGEVWAVRYEEKPPFDCGMIQEAKRLGKISPTIRWRIFLRKLAKEYVALAFLNGKVTEEVLLEAKAETAACDHEWVNVGFTSLKYVCRKCNADKKSQP